MKKSLFLLVMATLLCSMFVSSCGAYKRLAYLQDMQVDSTYDMTRKPDSKIQIGDRINITVTCSSSPELAAPFNRISAASTVNSLTGSASVSVNTNEDKGYLVDKNGEITFPELGNIKVEGMTLDEVKEDIEGLLKYLNYIKDPIVIVEFMNFQVTLLGETAGVGNYILPEGSVDMFQLLAMSGDLTGDAIRTEVWVVRQENNKRKLYSINLKSVDCYDSPVFYLQQNDMVYVKPKNNKIDTATQNAFTIAGLFMSVLTVASNILLWATKYKQ